MTLSLSERGFINQNPGLSNLLSKERPGIVDTTIHPFDLTHNGWSVRLEKRPNGHADAVSYHLSRKITDGFDLEKLKRTIGLIDEEGKTISGYSLYTTANEDDAQVLNFSYQGLPTKNTRDIIVGLAREFLPEHLRSKPLLPVVSSSINSNGLSVPIFERIVRITAALPR